MLHNFGQRSGLYASFDNVNSEITDALNNAKNLVILCPIYAFVLFEIDIKSVLIF